MMMWYMDIIQCGLIENVQNDHKMANTFCQTDLKVINLLWPMPHHVSMPDHCATFLKFDFQIGSSKRKILFKASPKLKIRNRTTERLQMIEEQIEDFLAYINISHSHRMYLSVLMWKIIWRQKLPKGLFVGLRTRYTSRF